MNIRPMLRAQSLHTLWALVIAGLGPAAPTTAFAAESETWPVIGQQGLVRFVLVPPGQASTLDAYETQISRLCEPDRTCFINFYTNSTGAALAMPLPDTIANEATATYRRSMKNGVQVFLWSCRLKLPGRECF
jgi:hypothetical protein